MPAVMGILDTTGLSGDKICSNLDPTRRGEVGTYVLDDTPFDGVPELCKMFMDRYSMAPYDILGRSFAPPDYFYQLYDGTVINIAAELLNHM
jgi:hypothetical protein